MRARDHLLVTSGEEGIGKLIFQNAAIWSGFSSNRPTPLSERTNPEIPILYRPDQMPGQIEQIEDSSMATQ